MRVVLLLLCFLVVAAAGMRDTRKIVQQRNADLAVVHWASARTGPYATVLASGITQTLQYGSTLRPIELYDTSPGQLRTLVRQHPHLYLLVAVPDMEGQWARLNPGRDYRLLATSLGLQELGQFQGYTLFRVGHARDIA